MNVLFLTSHSLGRAAAYHLRGMGSEGDSMTIHAVDCAIETYPKDYSLGVSFLYNSKIPASELNVKNRTWINFHPAPLPEYRGRNVAYQAIRNGDPDFGATLHYVDETFDTGDIITVSRFPIEPTDHAGDVAEKARYACLDLFKEYIPLFLAGQKPQGYQQRSGNYYKRKPINSEIQMDAMVKQQIRAVTAPPHYAYVNINGRKYNLIPE